MVVLGLGGGKGSWCGKKGGEVGEGWILRVETPEHSPSTLESVYREEINSKLDGALRVTNGGAFVQNRDALLLELGNNWPRAIACRLDDLDALVNDRLCVGVVCRSRLTSVLPTRRVPPYPLLKAKVGLG